MSKWQTPTGWGWVRIGDVCRTTSGGTPSRRRPDYFQGNIPWVKSGELNDGLVIEVEEFITGEAEENSNAKRFPKGTLLIAMYGATVGKLGILGMEAATNQAICAIFPPETLERDFLFYYLRSVRNELLNVSMGGAQPNISQTVIRDVQVPIPYPDDPPRSLATQRRIVARIEALLAEVREMRELQEEIKRNTSKLMAGSIQQVFDQKQTTWITQDLSNVAYVQTGTAKGRRYGDRPTVELPYLRVANVQAGHLDLSEIKTIPIAIDEIDRYRLQVGDLLLTEGGDYDKLGRGSVWIGDIDPCVHQNHVFAVRFDQSKVLPRFAEYEMQSEYAKQYFLKVAKKTTNLASINKTQLSAFPLKYPPTLGEQLRIIEYLDTIKSEVTDMHDIEASDTELIEKLEQAILAQAFRGEL